MTAARFRVGEGDGPTVADVLEKIGGDARRAADDGRAFINGKRALAADKVRAGDAIEVHAPRDAPLERARVIASRGGLVAVDKPAALPTTPDRRGERSLLGDVAAALEIPADRVHAASRLDVGVSGVVLCTLDAEAAKLVETARDRGAYLRVYLAIASGQVAGDGVWQAPIGTRRSRGSRALPAAFGRDARVASTRFSALANSGAATLLRLEPITGRSHQLRVHAQHAGAPLFGDRDHGGPRTLTAADGRVQPIDRIALHARGVSIAGVFEAESPVPDALVALWNALGGDPRAWDMR